ncbi:hypothetical protein [Protofrankia coriariae]|uniref:Universal stress protein n=1 Tax=Protofrankia coriariae TaxID=1562887 RepID=A0ABR5EZP7_9ACTN|nr:hypothetical protein [Protofrankia coriariae]KLL09953.1 hypothetical protein FrCorBMG51_21200 [Protofrankia coriariae]
MTDRDRGRSSMIVVFGGVQIDSRATNPPRFRERDVPDVERRTADALGALRPRLLVGAAASGADLVVLAAARSKGLPVRVVLPFDVPTFKQTSVEDRGPQWCLRYDQLISSLKPDELEILDEIRDAGVYHRTNTRLLERAARLRQTADEEIVALVLRPVVSHRASVTDDLVDKARHAGLRVVEVPTLG